MKSYVISVKQKDSAPYSEPLKFKTYDVHEVVEIFELMMRYGHIVIVEPVDEPDPDQESEKEETPSELVEIKISVKDPEKTV